MVTDKSRYIEAEDVEITIESCNRTDQQYTQHYTGSYLKVWIEDSDGHVVADHQPNYATPQVISEVTWAPRECKRLRQTWRQNEGPTTYNGSDDREPGPRAKPGIYYVVVEWKASDNLREPPSGPPPTVASAPFELA